MTTDLRQKIHETLVSFDTENLRASAMNFLQTLGYHSDRTVELPDNAPETFAATVEELSGEKLNREKALFEEWTAAEMLFQITDDELQTMVGEPSLFASSDIETGRLESYFFFALHLKGGGYSRTKLAGITRQINRLFPMPVMILYVYYNALSIAIINRRPNKKDGSRDVLEKVTLIHEIDLEQPHRGHLDILADLSFASLPSRRPINSFGLLHKAWAEVFNVELLNKRFYRRIQEWFYWAVKNVKFPAGNVKDEDTRNRMAVIRMLTRLMFCWFAREKGLLTERLFEANEIREMLKGFDKYSQKGNYYLAILQNLFFPTLAVPVDEREFRKDSTGRNNAHYMDHSVYRHKSSFREPNTLQELFAEVPFLNGGLFECLDYRYEDQSGKNREVRVDGFSDIASKQPNVPNYLFFAEEKTVDLDSFYETGGHKAVKVSGLFEILKKHKFTIVENTPVEEEIALDPELLGRMFESLLAEFNEETKVTARKQTGSFYTPRTIVDYMVDEALKVHLRERLVEKCSTMTNEDAEVGLNLLFTFTEEPHPFTEDEKSVLVDAIYDATVLDPACGSGAFPIGMLQKLVYVLDKLDTGHEQWKQRILGDTPAPMKEDMRQLLERSSVDFRWKLGLIQHCLYGVDIQPIAVQVAKLRCFLSLLVDFPSGSDVGQLEIPSLPNLDFKFVAADTLIRPPSEIEGGDNELGYEDPFFADFAQLAEEFFYVDNPARKDELRRAIEKQIDKKIKERVSRAAKEKRELEMREKSGEYKAAKDRKAARKQHKKIQAKVDAAERERKLWESYRNIFVKRNRPVQFFDSKYFFPEVKDGFDIVLGNPPYIKISNFSKERKEQWQAQEYEAYSSAGDIYCLFYERGLSLARSNGVLCYISSNKFMRAGYGRDLRRFLAAKTALSQLIDFGELPVFEAGTDPCVLLCRNVEPSKEGNAFTAASAKTKEDIANIPGLVSSRGFACEQKRLSSEGWTLERPDVLALLNQIQTAGTPLGESPTLHIHYGVKSGLDEAFVIDSSTRDYLVRRDPKSAELIKPWLRGKDVSRWYADFKEMFAIYIQSSANRRWPWTGQDDSDAEAIFQREYSAIFEHLQPYKPKLKRRDDQGRFYWEWRSCVYNEAFENSKIIYPDIAKLMRATYDATGYYAPTTIFIIPGAENKWMVALLNSKVVDWFVRHRFQSLGDPWRGGRIRFKKQYMERLPIPSTEKEHSEQMEAHIDRILEAKRSDPAADVSELEAEIDRLVYDLYGLADDEIAIIEGRTADMQATKGEA